MLKILRLLICIGAFACFANTTSAENVATNQSLSKLSADVRAKVEDLKRRLAEQGSRWNLPREEKGILVADELKEYCKTSDLIQLIQLKGDSEAEFEIYSAASWLLEETYFKDLTSQDVADLSGYILRAELGEQVLGMEVSAGRVLVKNRNNGLPAITNLLRESSNQIASSIAACAINTERGDIDSSLKREAQLVLLKSLAGGKELGIFARNCVQPLEPWMVEWLVESLSSESVDLSYRAMILSLLDMGVGKGHDNELRMLFLQAVKHSDENIRSSGIVGLLRQGVKEEDFPLYEAILENKNPDHENIRIYVYEALSWSDAKHGPIVQNWILPFLLAGLEDPSAKVVAVCATGLGNSERRQFVPKLVETFKKHSLTTYLPRGSLAQDLGSAIGKLSKKDFFKTRITHEGRKYLERYPDEGLETARLLKWWEDTGSKEQW